MHERGLSKLPHQAQGDLLRAGIQLVGRKEGVQIMRARSRRGRGRLSGLLVIAALTTALLAVMLLSLGCGGTQPNVSTTQGNVSTTQGTTSSTQGSASTDGGVFIYASMEPPTAWDPALEGLQAHALCNTYERLTHYNSKTGKAQPELATDWSCVGGWQDMDVSHPPGGKVPRRYSAQCSSGQVLDRTHKEQAGGYGLHLAMRR